MKIFLTIGTSNFAFPRFFNKMEFFINKNSSLIDDVIFQVGVNSYDAANLSGVRVCVFDYVERKKFTRFLSDADLIICHGAAGTILSCLAHGKIPIVLPRLFEKKEHSDDHQFKSSKIFHDMGICKIFSDDMDISSLSKVAPMRLSGLELNDYV